MGETAKEGATAHEVEAPAATGAAGPTAALGPVSFVLALQRRAGNAAVARMLAAQRPDRPTLARGLATDIVDVIHSGMDQAKEATGIAASAEMLALERRMERIAAEADARHAAISALAQEDMNTLRAASTKLKETSAAYEDAHGDFMAVLGKAQKEHEFKEAVLDFVQDKLVSVAVAALTGPAAPAVARLVGAMKLNADVAKHALSAAGWAVEKGATAAVEAGPNAVREGPAPEDAAKHAGPAPGERFKWALEQLDALIQALPDRAGLLAVTHGVSTAAGDVSKAAALLAGGATAQWSEAEATDKGAAVTRANGACAADEKAAETAASKLASIASQLSGIQVKSKYDIERMLWTQWAANLPNGSNLIELPSIAEKLRYWGLLDTKADAYVDDTDEQAASDEARARMLRDMGISPPSDPVELESLYRREMRRGELAKKLKGQRGRNAARQITVGDGTYASQLDEECEAVVNDVTVSPMVLMRGDAKTKRQWVPGDFVLLVARVESAEEARRREQAAIDAEVDRVSDELPPFPANPVWW